MNNKGVTLIEVMAAVVLLLMITVVTAPSIINRLSERKNDISDTTLDMIYTQANMYATDHNLENNAAIGQSFCVSLDTLVKEGYLQKPLKDFKTGDAIPLTKYVKMKINSYGDFGDFSLTNSSC